MKSKQQGSAITAYLLFIALAVIGACGWVANIVTLAGSDFSHITGMLVLRVVGIFVAPLGAVLGFF